MTVQETFQQFQYKPLADRIKMIELLLQSVKDEIAESKPVVPEREPFYIETFNLGEDVHIDRDEMYLHRGL